ncbi:MAG: DUF1476 family protein [Proteobacteria bacterium]|nr:DUF1476 family protein [Pseudomonadota bacterium]
MNCLEISGEVCHVDLVRYTPAGIPALNLTLKHSSEQIEANLKRTINCELSAKIMGNDEDQTKEYIQSVIKADFAEAGDDDVFRKVKADFDNKNISNDQQIRSKMDELLEQVKKDYL